MNFHKGRELSFALRNSQTTPTALITEVKWPPPTCIVRWKRGCGEGTGSAHRLLLPTLLEETRHCLFQGRPGHCAPHTTESGRCLQCCCQKACWRRWHISPGTRSEPNLHLLGRMGWREGGQFCQPQEWAWGKVQRGKNPVSLGKDVL